MPSFSRLYKTLRDLGPSQVTAFAAYQLRLRSGLLRRQTPPGGNLTTKAALHFAWPVPERQALRRCLGPEGEAALLAEADEIVAGKVRLFGGPPVELHLTPEGPLQHWTLIREGGSSSSGGVGKGEGRGVRGDDREEVGGGAGKGGSERLPDVKFVWEPARFGWATCLARAYYLTGDERYPEAFWRYTETFLEANPPNLGLHWASAQEVALRLVALVFAARLLDGAPQTTPARRQRLAQAVAEHAGRIPPTLDYARAQNNNHLLTEAAGLYTAGMLLPGHPQAAAWRKLGWRWFHHGLRLQIYPDGAYAQHSTNYQRLMLQTALWMHTLSPEAFPPVSRQLLAASTRWLLALVDPVSGSVPNLGPNDGAYILPLTICSFGDYRPVLEAASRAFLGRPAFSMPDNPPSLEEMALWLAPEPVRAPVEASPETGLAATPHILAHPTLPSWGYLRLAHFHGRPAHADQLHLDLWWQGGNIARDAGTYLYNAPAPWENPLTHASVHNTLTVDGQDQMTRLGRFLYVDKAQARLVEGKTVERGESHPRNERMFTRLVGEHDGYRRLGITHRREVTSQPDGWLVRDELLSPRTPPPDSVARLHWLLPDTPWEVFECSPHCMGLVLHLPQGDVRLEMTLQCPCDSTRRMEGQLVRAGETVWGPGAALPYWGWYSPTFGVKLPALSLSLTFSGVLPLAVVSEWVFPEFRSKDGC